MKKIEKLALSLLILAGINWGIWGLADKFNLIDYIVGNYWIANVIYFLTGAAAIYLIIMWYSIFPKKGK
jgi:uncharacterized membrane protein YuzA (DUF378 family)